VLRIGSHRGRLKVENDDAERNRDGRGLVVVEAKLVSFAKVLLNLGF